MQINVVSRCVTVQLHVVSMRVNVQLNVVAGVSLCCKM